MHSCAGRRMTLIRAAIIAGALSSAGCGARSPTEPSSTSGLVVLFGALGCQQLRAGRVVLLHALVRSGDTYRQVTSEATWTTSDPGVIRPNATRGSFTMLGSGVVEARAEYQGQFAFVSFTVGAPGAPYLEVTATSAGPKQLTGRAQLWSASGAITDITSSATFVSSDPRIARVDGRSIVLMGGIGNVEITGTANGMSGTCGASNYPTPVN
jgi:hypothetical protein